MSLQELTRNHFGLLGYRMDTDDYEDALRASRLHPDQIRFEQKPIINPFDGLPMKSHHLNVAFRKLSDQDENERRYDLGVVGARYELVSSAESLAPVQEIVRMVPGARIIAGGMVESQAWMVVSMPNSIRIKGTDDVSSANFVALDSHDGSKALSFFTTLFRLICRNQFHSAAAGAEYSASIRHTQSIQVRIDIASKAITAHARGLEYTNTVLNDLASVKVSKGIFERVITEIWGVKKEDAENGEVSTQKKNMMERWMSRWESNDGNAFPTLRGTVYQLHQSLVEYRQYDSIVKGEDRDGRRRESTMFGKIGDDNRRDLLRLMEWSKDEPRQSPGYSTMVTVPVQVIPPRQIEVLPVYNGMS